MTFILSLSSAMVGFWVFPQLHTLQYRQKLLLWLIHFELLQNLFKVCTHWKILSSVLIYLYRSWCLIYKQLHRGLSLKNSYSNILLCYPEILYNFQSIIWHPHIISEMLQSSHSLSCKYRCRCQNRQISGRGSQAVYLRIDGNKGHNVLPRFGPS